MLYLEFTAADLGRVRVAGALHPLWELILSINSLQAPQLPPRYWSWRSDTLRVGRAEEEAKRGLAAAATLVPLGDFPDFLTPAIAELDIEAHYEAIAAVPKQEMRADLVRTFARRGAPPRWARDLHSHGRMDGVVTVLRRSHALLTRPESKQMHSSVELDRARYARHLLDGGAERLLENLHPSIRWRSSVLECDYPVDRHVNLAGRGLTVLPAYFCWGQPVTFIHPENPPILVVPTSADLPGSGPADETDEVVDRLAGLVGVTRARMLHELTVAASTTEIAVRLGISAAAVSQHTRVLREAKLVVTARFGKSVRHVLTPLGTRLLRGT
jgi:hypothetical protein